MATKNAAAPRVETYEVGSGLNKYGKPYLRVSMWANGRSTASIIFGDNRAHLLTVLEGMVKAVQSWEGEMPQGTGQYAPQSAAAKTATAAPQAAAPDLAAIMAAIAELQAENAALRGEPAAAAPAPAPTNGTQTKLSRIRRSK